MALGWQEFLSFSDWLLPLIGNYIDCRETDHGLLICTAALCFLRRAAQVTTCRPTFENYLMLVPGNSQT